MTGVETFVLTLCAAQRRRGLEPAIVCDLEGRDELRTSAAAMSVEVHSVPLSLPASTGRGAVRKMASATFRVKRMRHLTRILSSARAEVLHVHAVGVGGLDAFVAARRTHVPFIVTHHATLAWFEPFRTTLTDFAFWYEKRMAARIVCPYGAARDEMVAHGVSEAQATVVPFCVDPRKFDHAIDPPATTSSFRLFFVARLIDGKGHRELLQAVARLPHLHATLRVVVMGDGPERSAIEAQVQELGLGALVDVMGHVANEKVPALMRTASAVVLPSYMPGETFPLSLIEGMAMHLPTIGSRWFGIPDIVVDGETGLVVEPRDVDGLAQAIERLVTSPELARQMGQKGYERAMKLFTSDAVAEAYEQIYGEALGGRLR